MNEENRIKPPEIKSNQESNPSPDKTPETTPKKSNNTMWWALGISCVVFFIAAAIIIYLVIGWLLPQKNTKRPEPKSFDIEDIEKNTKNDTDNDIKKLEDEIKKLEDKLKDNDKKDSGDDDNDDNKPEPIPEPETGIIEGSLSYPSEQIPDLTVCAEEVNNMPNTVCTSSLIDDPSFTAGRGYQLEVDPGDYYVYSYFIDKTHPAYYTEFVPCGMDISCPSHDYIPVTVTVGDHIYDIDPVDWYMP